MENKNSETSKIIYSKVNGVTNPFSCGQIISVFVFIVIMILHSNLMSTIVDIDTAILWVLMALTYIFLIFIIIDFLIITLGDPADPNLKEKSMGASSDQLTQKYCKKCESNVNDKSYHCKSCDRCVEEFDHHCYFLNNCIGKQNYTPFFRLLISIIIFCVVCVGQGLYIFTDVTDYHQEIALGLVVSGVFICLEAIVLSIFHLYLYYHQKTTLEFVKEKMSPNVQTSNSFNKNAVANERSNSEVVEQTNLEMRRQQVFN